MNDSAIIVCEGVSKRFGAVTAVVNVSLSVREGEFFALLGPSGCGKTTMLRILAGLDVPSEGRIVIDGRDMAGVPPNRRPVNMVFQSYALFPHMSVAENVGYGLKVAGVAAAERWRRAAEALALVQLESLAKRMPDELSGGQRQRAALARALIKKPRVLLLDEPLSALDAKLREQMRVELAQLQKKIGTTFVLVTHDQNEALALASRCAVMNAGVLEQVASPDDLYERPASRFVADFIGLVNLFEGVLSEDKREVACAELKAPVALDYAPDAAPGSGLCIAIRPEKIAMEKATEAVDAPTRNGAAGTIRQVSYLGSESLFQVETDSGRVVKVLRSNLRARDTARFATGERVVLSWPAWASTVVAS